MSSSSIHYKNNSCPAPTKLELECLRGTATAPIKSHVKDHVEKCRDCNQQYEFFERFYAILTAELFEPVPHRLLDFVKSKLDRSVKSAIVLCSKQPNSDLQNVSVYHTKLVFEANGHNGHSKLSNYDFSSVQEDQIVLRILKFANNEAIVFFWTPKPNLISNRYFQFAHSSEKLETNHFCAAVIKCDSLQELDQTTLYSFKHNNGSSASHHRSFLDN